MTRLFGSPPLRSVPPEGRLRNTNAGRLYDWFQSGGLSRLPQLASMNSRNDRADPRLQPSVKPPVKPPARQPVGTPLIPPGLVPKNPDQLFPYQDSESTQPITMDSLRGPERRGDPIPQALTPIPQALTPIPQALTPSQIIQTSPAATGKLTDDSAGLASPQGKPVAASPFLPIQPNYIDRTNESYDGRPVLPNEMMPYEQTGRVPMSPGVNESFIFPSRSEQGRSLMQPSGMGGGDYAPDGYGLEGRGAVPGVRFDATMFGSRKEQIDFLNDQVEEHMANANRAGVVRSPSGARTTINSDPTSSEYGRKSTVGQPVTASSGQLLENKARAEARRTGSTYTDTDGSVTDYGMLNKNREAYEERTEERKNQVRELRMRAAQMQDYGRTGGVGVYHGGGGMHSRVQPTFGPNMTRSQAIGMAQRQVDQRNALRDAEARKQEADKIEGLKYFADQGDTDAANALRSMFGVDINESDTNVARQLRNTPAAPSMNGRSFADIPHTERGLMALQVKNIINNKGMSDEQKKIALAREYPELQTLAGINALQDGTEFDHGPSLTGPQGLFGMGDYELTEDLKRIMGIGSSPPLTQTTGSNPAMNPPNQGVSPSSPAVQR